MFRFSARGDPKDWAWGNRESGEDPWAAYMVFCKVNFKVMEANTC